MGPQSDLPKGCAVELQWACQHRSKRAANPPPPGISRLSRKALRVPIPTRRIQLQTPREPVPGILRDGSPAPNALNCPLEQIPEQIQLRARTTPSTIRAQHHNFLSEMTLIGMQVESKHEKSRHICSLRHAPHRRSRTRPGTDCSPGTAIT
jgi:hypothetical protein